MNPKRKWRWKPQISLRRLLILWSVGGIFVTWFAYHYRHQLAERKAIANIRERTTSFRLNDYQSAGPTLPRVEISPGVYLELYPG